MPFSKGGTQILSGAPSRALLKTQSAVLPLAPYLDPLRWVFIVVALGGIAVTICPRLDDWHRVQR